MKYLFILFLIAVASITFSCGKNTYYWGAEGLPTEHEAKASFIKKQKRDHIHKSSQVHQISNLGSKKEKVPQNH